MNYELSIMDKRNKRGFTLLEILVATTIFAIIMVVAGGVFGMGSTYNVKMKAMRQVGEDARRLTDAITNNVRSVDGTIKLNIALNGTDAPLVPKEFKNGIAIVSPHGVTPPSYNYEFNATPSVTFPNTSTGAQVLILAIKDKYKIYYSSHSTHHLYYKTIPRLDGSGNVVVLAAADLISVKDDYDAGTTLRVNGFSSPYTESYLSFAGFAPDDSITSQQQPYVDLFIQSKSSDFDQDVYNGNGTTPSAYDKKIPSSRALAEINTTVTSRSYNP